jgi:hypothetical protein
VSPAAIRASLLASMMALAVSCQDDPVAVAPASGGGDHGRTLVIAAVGQLTSARHTPAAFAHFRDQVLALRPGMDESVSDEAELFAVTQAVDVVRQIPEAPHGAEALVLTVWPLALAPPIEAPIPGARDLDRWTPWMPTASETAQAYLERLCGDPLALECKNVVPEGQAVVVGALAIERLTERARRAVSLCLTCSDPTWAARLGVWELLDREATASRARAQKRFAPARWPVAGVGGREPGRGPLLAVEENGAMELRGVPFSPDDEPAAIEALRAARESTGLLRVHLPPKLTTERVRRAQGVAAAAGYTSIALVARDAAYPYRPRDYVIGVKDRPPVKDGDPIQVLLRVLDTRARKAGDKTAP